MIHERTVVAPGRVVALRMSRKGTHLMMDDRLMMWARNRNDEPFPFFLKRKKRRSKLLVKKAAILRGSVNEKRKDREARLERRKAKVVRTESQDSLALITMNVHGALKSTKGDEMKVLEFGEHMRVKGIEIACVQESGMPMEANSTNVHTVGADMVVLHNGTKKGGLGSGVSIILLGSKAREWKKSKAEPLRFGTRIIATRIKSTDPNGDVLSFFVVSGYCPCDGNAHGDKREVFIRDLERCIDECKESEILVIGADWNAKIGERKTGEKKILGAFAGNDVRNPAGKDLVRFMHQNTLCSTLSFFDKAKQGYWTHESTFTNIRGKNGKLDSRLTLDYVLVKHCDLRRVTDANVIKVKDQPCASDHRAITVQFKVRKVMKKRESNSNAGKTIIDRTLLQRKEVREEYCKLIDEAMVTRGEEFRDRTPIGNRASSTNSYDMFQEANKAAIESLCTVQKPKKNRGWFDAATLCPLISERNLEDAKLRKWRRKAAKTRKRWKRERAMRKIKAARKRLRATKRALKVAVKSARKEVQDQFIEELGGDQNRKRVAWDLIKELNGLVSGYMKKDSSTNFINYVTGLKATSDAENSAATSVFFDNVFNPPDLFAIDPTELEKIEPLGIGVELLFHLEKDISEEEAHSAVKRCCNGKASGENGLFAESLKAAISQESTSAVVLGVLRDYWNGCEYSQFQTGLLKILFKGKGDPADLNNQRGIMLLDVMSKIVSSIISERLALVLDEFGLQEQAGFMKGRGCFNAILNTRLILKERQRAGKDTWALFIDLVKAFDTIPREGLFQVLGKFGIPDKLIKVIRRLYTGLKVKIKTGDSEAEVDSTQGVKQGDNLAPCLFLFMMQAVTSTIKEEWESAGLCVKTVSKDDGMVSGSRKKGDCDRLYKHPRPQDNAGTIMRRIMGFLYADDTGLLFESRDKLRQGASIIAAHFKKFGMKMHVGTRVDDQSISKSKSVAVFFPGNKLGALRADGKFDSIDASTLRSLAHATFDAEIVVNGKHICLDNDQGYVEIVKEFVYLGSELNLSLHDVSDMRRRIKKASCAFAVLHKSVFSCKKIALKQKGSIYIQLVLSILLYGSETWSLTKTETLEMRTFHRYCVRRMNRKSMRDRLTATELEKRLDIGCVLGYWSNRTLVALGKIGRAEATNLERCMLMQFPTTPRLLDRSRPRSFACTVQMVHFDRIKSHPNCSPAIKEALQMKDRTITYFHRADGRRCTTGYGDNSKDWTRIAEDRTIWESICQLSFHHICSEEVRVKFANLSLPNPHNKPPQFNRPRALVAAFDGEA